MNFVNSQIQAHFYCPTLFFPYIICILTKNAICFVIIAYRSWKCRIYCHDIFIVIAKLPFYYSGSNPIREMSEVKFACRVYIPERTLFCALICTRNTCWRKQNLEFLSDTHIKVIFWGFWKIKIFLEKQKKISKN